MNRFKVCRGREVSIYIKKILFSIKNTKKNTELNIESFTRIAYGKDICLCGEIIKNVFHRFIFNFNQFVPCF